jgi:3-hydroxyacyl-[acyl-carrier-protein] dehydratase
MKWYSLIRISRPAADEVVAEVEVNADSPWFSGHFQGNPILPGVAQLEMVFDTIQEFGHKACRVSEIKKVRFKQMIRPNDTMRIITRLRERSPTSYSFRVMVKGQLACSGLLVTEE